jgi:signal peptidase II
MQEIDVSDQTEGAPAKGGSETATLSLGQRLLPLSLTGAVVALDQITKAAIVAAIPYQPGRPGVGAVYFDGLLRIIHTRNPGIAFSIGGTLPDTLRMILFTVMPVIVLTALAIYYLRSDEFSGLQRWAIAGILGGGVGNLIDRLFRPSGVVDFIDVKFFGIFGLERWPTFNVADSTVVVSGILLALSIFLQRKKT